METNEQRLQENLCTIASELFRFQRVFTKAISKLEQDEQNKYARQFAWFAKKITQALAETGLRMINIEGQIYDPGMAITPLNIDDFAAEDALYVAQMIEPIVMHGDAVYRTGTAILGRIEEK